MQVFHHLAQLIQQLLRLGHAPLFHQLLKAVQHVLQLVAGNFLPVAVFGKLVAVARLLGQLRHVILHRLAQFFHQFGNFFVRCAFAHRLFKTLLCPAQALHRVRQIAVLDQHRDIPQHFRDFGLPIL